MRCRCCNEPLSSNDIPAWNKLANQEDDMCATCRFLVYNSYTEREYVGGRYPVDGATGPLALRDS